jgi:hypothetical protein
MDYFIIKYYKCSANLLYFIVIMKKFLNLKVINFLLYYLIFNKVYLIFNINL